MSGFTSISADAVATGEKSLVERLQIFANHFPNPEKAYFYSLVLHADHELLSALKEYDEKKCSIDELKARIIRRVVKMSIDNCFTIYTKMFEHISTEEAKRIVKGSAPVIAQTEPSVSLTYGEIDFFSLSCILENLNIKKGDTFVDLGHGTGKAIVCASLLYGTKLNQCIGIELIPELYHISVGVVDKFREMVAADSSRFGTEPICDIHVMEGDILGPDYDWTTAGSLKIICDSKYKH